MSIDQLPQPGREYDYGTTDVLPPPFPQRFFVAPDDLPTPFLGNVRDETAKARHRAKRGSKR